MLGGPSCFLNFALGWAATGRSVQRVPALALRFSLEGTRVAQEPGRQGVSITEHFRSYRNDHAPRAELLRWL